MTNPFERELESRKNYFREKFWEDTPHALELLKAHLLAEEVLEEIIASACREPELFFEAKITFYAKIKIAHAILGGSDPIWTCLDKLNSARNELAHGRDGGILAEKLEKFIAFARVGYPQATWTGERSHDVEMAAIAIHAALSRLATDRKLG